MTTNDEGSLDGLIRAIEHAEELDRMWFQEHPRRRFRLRYMLIGEFGLHREDPWAGMWNLSYTIVFRFRHGQSGRDPRDHRGESELGLDGGSEDRDAELRRGVWQGRGVGGVGADEVGVEPVPWIGV